MSLLIATLPGDDGNGNGEKKWRLNREKILMYAGLAIICATWINSELLGRPFHYEYLVLGAALCGISITTWGDKR